MSAPAPEADEPPGPAREPEPDPLRMVCPRCGADSDSPTAIFEIGRWARAPRAEYLLADAHCWTCGTTTDIAVWVLDTEGFLAGLDPGAEPTEPGSLALVDRYLAEVERARRAWERCYAEDGTRLSVDCSADAVDLGGERPVVVSAGALAAARGLRQAVAAHPGADPVGPLLVGHLSLVLSLAEQEAGPFPFALHLSVANQVTPALLTSLEAGFALSLVFRAAETPFLRAEPGWMRPVTHYYLGSDSPDFADC